eukprot:3932773-Rhodomonas_salina.1
MPGRVGLVAANPLSILGNADQTQKGADRGPPKACANGEASLMSSESGTAGRSVSTHGYRMPGGQADTCSSSLGMLDSAVTPSIIKGFFLRIAQHLGASDACVRTGHCEASALEDTWYASDTFLNMLSDFSLFGSLHRSGCHFKAIFLYAFLISSALDLGPFGRSRMS